MVPITFHLRYTNVMWTILFLQQLVQANIKQTPEPRITGALLWWILVLSALVKRSAGTGGHKEVLKQKSFPRHDVIMNG